MNSIDPASLMALGATAILIVCALLLLPAIFYLLTLMKCLQRCAPANRALSPGLVWLLLIPLFNLIWNFFVVINIAKSLGAEFRQRGIAAEPDPGKGVGLAMAILACCGLIPVAGLFAELAGFVLWIIYWVAVAGFSNKLAAMAAAA